MLIMFLGPLGNASFAQTTDKPDPVTSDSSLGSLVILVGDDADIRSFDFEIENSEKNNDWNFFTDITKFRLKNSESEGVEISCNPESPVAGAPYLWCEGKTGVLGADFEVRNAKNLKPGVYTGTKEFEIFIIDETSTATKSDFRTLTLIVIKQGYRIKEGRIRSVSLTGEETQPRLGGHLLCEFTLQSFEPNTKTVLPKIDFSLDWTAGKGGRGTTLLSARVPFDTDPGSASRMLKIDQENTLPKDGESPNDENSPLRTLFNSRTAMETGFPLAWTDPIVRTDIDSKQEKTHLDYDQQSELKILYEHISTIRVVCPALDVLGTLSATAQLAGGPVFPISADIQSAIGVFPPVALEGERVLIVVASGSADVADQARVGDEFVSLERIDDERVGGWLMAKYGSFDVSVPKLPKLEIANLLVPVNVVPVTNPRYLMFGTASAAIWEFAPLRRFVKPAGYTAYPAHGWTITVEDAFTFRNLHTGTIASLEIDPVGVVMPQASQGTAADEIHRLLKSELMPGSVLVASVTDPSDQQLTGIESTSINLKFGDSDFQPDFGNLPVTRQFEIPVRLSFTTANGQSYERIASLHARLTIENGTQYDWYAGAIIAAFAIVVGGFVALRKWVNKPLKPRPLNSRTEATASDDGFGTSGSESPFDKESPGDQWGGGHSASATDRGSSSSFGSDDASKTSSDPFGDA